MLAACGLVQLCSCEKGIYCSAEESGPVPGKKRKEPKQARKSLEQNELEGDDLQQCESVGSFYAPCRTHDADSARICRAGRELHR